MEFIVNCESRAGEQHKASQRENQDACCSMQEDGICCLCIADGAGSKRYSHIGARQLVRDLCNQLLAHAREIFQMDHMEISVFVVDHMKTSLKMTASCRNIKIQELSSTFLFVLTDGQQYVIGHLGDGVIIGEKENGWNILSFPKNGISSRSTYLSTMPSVEKHLRIYKSDCNTMYRIWLMTDGAMYAAFEPEFTLPAGRSLEQTVLLTSDQSIEDDVTYGFVSWRKQQYATRKQS